MTVGDQHVSAGLSRRTVLTAGVAALAFPAALAGAPAAAQPAAVKVETTVNLTSFDEDPRPPFRFVTAASRLRTPPCCKSRSITARFRSTAACLRPTRGCSRPQAAARATSI